MWILVLLGLAGVIAVASKRGYHSPLLPPVKVPPKLSSGAVWVEGTPHLNALHRALRSGQVPDRHLVNGAMREAFDRQDWGTVAKISGAFPLSQPDEEETEEPNEPIAEPERTEDAHIVIGKSSPFEGVTNDEWGTFVDKLKTQEPSFKNEKHIGAYHHNRERLTELGLDPDKLSDESAQYDAVVRDLSAYRAAEQALIRDFSGDVVTIDGNPHGITLSGILGLLKAAGPKNARSWLRNEKERSEFPRTTQTFLETNGLF